MDKITKKVQCAAFESIPSWYANGTGLQVKISMLSLAKSSKDFKSLVLRNHKLQADEVVHFANFCDLLDKMLMVDPEKRISAKDALRHPFVTTKM